MFVLYKRQKMLIVRNSVVTYWPAHDCTIPAAVAHQPTALPPHPDSLLAVI
jgi:hypothetical protein